MSGMTAGRVLDTFMRLVRIDSPSRREGELARHCIGELEGLGFTVRVDDTTSVTGSDTGNVIAVLSGSRPGAFVLLLSAHLDCVQPCEGVVPHVADGVVTSAGETVLGADDKAGIAAILEGVRRAVESGAPRGTIKVVLTVAEEEGLAGAKALDLSEIEADLCLVLDADGAPGGVVVAAPTHFTFTATFEGIASHAGIEPEKGSSAIVMAAEAVCAMALGRVDELSTANVGTVSGGVATNVVPGSAVLSGECRSLDDGRAEEIRAAMDAQLREAALARGGGVTIEWVREYSAFSVADDAPALAVLMDACAKTDLEFRAFQTGGGSDASVFAASGTPTLALSCGIRDAHSVRESILVADLESLAGLVHDVIGRFGRGPGKDVDRDNRSSG